MNSQNSYPICKVERIFVFSHAYFYGGDLDDFIQYNDITFVLNGSLTYVIDGEQIVFPADSAVVFPANRRRIRLESASSEVEYISFNFHTDLPLKLPFKIENCITEEISSLLKTFESIYGGHTKHREEEYLLLFQTILLTLDDIASLNRQNPHIDKILSYIDRHFREKIRLQDIAETVHLAPSYCSNLIKKELGVTVLEIVTAKRMELARDLLYKKEKPLNEIARICGYNYYNQFYRCFKRMYGYNPSDIYGE